VRTFPFTISHTAVTGLFSVIRTRKGWLMTRNMSWCMPVRLRDIWEPSRMSLSAISGRSTPPRRLSSLVAQCHIRSRHRKRERSYRYRIRTSPRTSRDIEGIAFGRVSFGKFQGRSERCSSSPVVATVVRTVSVLVLIGSRTYRAWVYGDGIWRSVRG